tara:strand:- start:2016 stop:2141 length:126 start_codon:yes stop_codon:yes gene_type:complete
MYIKSPFLVIAKCLGPDFSGMSTIEGDTNLYELASEFNLYW